MSSGALVTLLNTFSLRSTQAMSHLKGVPLFADTSCMFHQILCCGTLRKGAHLPWGRGAPTPTPPKKTYFFSFSCLLLFFCSFVVLYIFTFSFYEFFNFLFFQVFHIKKPLFFFPFVFFGRSKRKKKTSKSSYCKDDDFFRVKNW